MLLKHPGLVSADRDICGVRSEWDFCGIFDHFFGSRAVEFNYFGLIRGILILIHRIFVDQIVSVNSVRLLVRLTITCFTSFLVGLYYLNVIH